MVFYLPADATEKITLAISILLALVVFLLLVSKMLPPTSATIPLMAKYLLLIFVLNIITILVTVIVVNIYFRGFTTHEMPPFVRTVFLKYLPLLLMMERPVYDERRRMQWCRGKDGRRNAKNKTRFSGSYVDNEYWIEPGEFVEMSSPKKESLKVYHISSPSQKKPKREALLDDRCERSTPATPDPIFPHYAKIRHRRRMPQTLMNMPEEFVAEMPKQMVEAIEAIQYITEHIAKEDSAKK
ncbi:unnamed protein product, partial [Gongylonema pulchrum]|uniref:Neur_chan_memb domain-containing protein n=1 Tax=Gongylonema pulchrum TaxID=637853 RepID=A0A183D4W2_9BILA